MNFKADNNSNNKSKKTNISSKSDSILEKIEIFDSSSNSNSSKSNPNQKSLPKNKNKSEQKEENSNSSVKEYPIEKIIARRMGYEEIEYRVKWEGYENDQNTWEGLSHLIEDRCFDFLFDYENLSLEEKINLLNQYKPFDKLLEKISENNLIETEGDNQIENFKVNFKDFNPANKELLKEWNFGNLNEDEIDYIIPAQSDENRSEMLFLCFWKKREGEEQPRTQRAYKPKVIEIVDKENFYKALEQF